LEKAVKMMYEQLAVFLVENLGFEKVSTILEANLHSLEASLPRPEWVSPFSNVVAALLYKIGFRDITVKYFETNVKFRDFAALTKLEEWHIDPVFVKERFQDIRMYGLGYPMEHLIFCRK
jgi:hypothetical protein